MTAIWHNDGSGWRILNPKGFPDEAALHTLVEEAPQLLPLSGTPRLAIIGREVHLGSGYADLLGVEPSGRLALIEVKLSKNAEARRAVVAQVLTYAAYLRGMTRETLEQEVLAAYLRGHEHESLDHLLIAAVQDGSFDPAAFDSGLRTNLTDGRFRLVLVLDEAPSELIRLVGYLEQTADLIIDLITVSSYGLGDQRILVPQRVDPERPEQASVAKAPTPAQGSVFEGSVEYEKVLSALPEPARIKAMDLLKWARELEHRGLARLITYRAVAGYASLLPFVKGEDAGLVTLWSKSQTQVWRSVFQRRAPRALARLEVLMAPSHVGQGSGVKAVTGDILSVLTAAYEEAAGIEPRSTDN
jgi:hypothetical protein